MGTLEFHQYTSYNNNHKNQLMNPFCYNNLIRTAAAVKCFSTTTRNPCTSSISTSTSKVGVISRVCADELKQNWLNSLSCPPSMLESEERFGDRRGDAELRWVIGIDPDVSGALAVLKTDEFGSTAAAQVYDSPNVKMLVGKRIRRRMDTKAMVQLLRSLNIPIGTTAYIEQSLPFPGDGKQGWWSGGFNYGLWIGVLVASEISVFPVPSLRWKQEFKLSGNGKTKNDSRALACTLFPSLSSSLKRKKDHGRAEALLIAAYGKGIKLNPDPPRISESLLPIDTENTIL